MAFRPFFEIERIVGNVIGRDLVGNPEDAVQDWMKENLVPAPEDFKGTQANLQKLISSKADACAASVKKTGFLTGNNTARSLCLGALEDAYSTVLIDLQASSTAQDEQIKAKALQGNTQLYLIALVVIVILFIVLN